MEIKSKKITMVKIEKINPHPENMNIHPEDQIERLCAIINHYGFRNPLIVDKNSGLLAAGHGRLLAAKKLEMTEVPVIYQEFENEEELYAFMVADNAIAEWANLDINQINEAAMNFSEDFDTEMLGIKNFNLFEDQEPEEKPEKDIDVDGMELDNKCPKCNYTW